MRSTPFRALLSSRALSPVLTPLVATLVFCLPSGLCSAQTNAATSTQTNASTLRTAPVANRLTQPIDDKALVTLHSKVSPLAKAANDRGAAAENMRLDRLQIVLSRSSEQEKTLKRLVQDLHTPGSASYHKWLTPQQFGQQFGPSDQDIATLSNWLGTHGFSVTKVNPGKQTLEVSGSVGQFRSTFHADIHTYQVDGRMHYANANVPQIPAALAPVFGGFASLNNFPARSYVRKLGTAQYEKATHKTTPNWTLGDSNGVNFAFGPGDFAVQYDLNPLYGKGINGAGQSIAIVNEANVDPTIVAQYRTLFGLPANPVNVIVDGNDPGIDGNNNPDGPNGASIESYLDVEEAGAIAPSAQINLVIAGDTALSSGLFLAAEHAVYGNVAPVVSVSFGYCEANLGSTNGFLSNLWEQAAAQGQTVVVSTGDDGSASCDNQNTQDYAVSGLAVSGYASTPYNVAVGGTDFYYSDYANPDQNSTGDPNHFWNFNPSDTTPATSLLSKIPEQPWNDSQYGLNFGSVYANSGNTATTIAAGSGGASSCATADANSGACLGGYPKPAWQTGTGVPNDNVRDIPDVSFFAADGGNYSFYPICASDGDCQPVGQGGTVQITGVGGTSAGTPAFAGVMALINQTYGRQGQANFVLYPMARQFPAVFNDVVNGSNAVPCNITSINYNGSAYPPADCIAVQNPIAITDPTFGLATEGETGTGSTPGYNAAVGYDLASGWGSVDINALYTNWNKVTFAASGVTLTASQTNFAHGTAITISGAVTPGTATGAISLGSTSTQALQAAEAYFPLNNGTYSGSISSLPGGTYTLFADYAGDGVNAPSSSTPVSVTVTPEASSQIFQILDSDSTQSGYLAAGGGESLPYGTQLELNSQPVAAGCAVASPPATCSTDGLATGSVNFVDNGATINVAQVNANGEAEFNAPLGVGPHSITAAYSGDNSYNPSTSPAVAFTITKDAPTVYLNTGTQTNNSITGAAGTTVLQVAVLNTATGALLNSVPSAFVPVAAPTGVVTVTGNNGFPTLTFPALAGSYDANTRTAESFANIQIPASVPAGTYNLIVNYPGDANYSSVNTAVTPFAVTITTGASAGVATTTTVSATGAATAPNAAVTVSATVTGTAANGTPAGTLYFEIGSLTFTLPLPAGNGPSATATGQLNSSQLPEGSNAITAQYIPANGSPYAPSFALFNLSNATSVGTNPVGSFAATSSAPITLAQASSGTSTITVTPATGFSGNVALSCTVTPSFTAGVPTCTISPSPIAVNGAAGTATLTVNSTATTTAQNYIVQVTATSGNLSSIVSVPVTVTPQVVTTAAIALTSNPSSLTVTAPGTPVTSTITITPSGGFTGAVGLTCSVTPATDTAPPSCTVDPTVTIAGTTPGTATLTINTSATTTAETYTATVTGTATGAANATVAVPVTVSTSGSGTGTGTPTITLSNSGSITIASPGGMGTSTVSITPGGGFTGNVNLTCAVSPATQADTPTCSITSPVNITGTSAGTATLTVNTTAATGALAFPKMRALPLGGGVALAALAFLIVPSGRRRFSTLLVAMILLVAVGMSAGCSSGGSSQTPNNPGTATGSYTVTVSATATGAAAPAPVNVTVTLQ